ncbi:MAG TPA: phytanoyl-CoA dioxygenase family protein [Polyangiaceae bacterium]|jgi:ectoine hydroxylase-related dioxygenase (phytanoyl-CoA dioxygenase family)|nr:phytanoyl-CoA dioxygenase family protein [Polyangiaceae bacterium]
MQTFSPAELEQFKHSFAEDGYVVIRDAVSKERLADLRIKLLDALELSQRTGDLFNGGGGISGHLNCFPGEDSRFAYDALVERGIVELVKELSPHSFGPMRAGCNMNLPRSVPQHYHMDGIFLEDFMIANVAVVDTDLVNGAIDVVPGTQKKFYRYCDFAAGRVYRGSKRLPLSQGDVLVRTSKLWHRGMPNKASVPRPMLAFTFGEKNVREGEAFRDKGGKIGFDPNWFNPNWLGRVRERTFVTAPISYSAYRFVTSLFNNKGYAH